MYAAGHEDFAVAGEADEFAKRREQINEREIIIQDNFVKVEIICKIIVIHYYCLPRAFSSLKRAE